MKNISHIEISKDLMKKIISFFPSKKYKLSTTLFYEGHIPISGYLIIDGSIQISTKKKFKKLLQKGALVGFYDLVNKKPSIIKAEVFPNTEICYLDKTTVIEMSKNADPELSLFMKEIIEGKK
jgi:CRP-like cAMP-binding protein